MEATTNSVDQQFPDTIWLGLKAYEALVGLTSDDGRPMFPFLGPQNALGNADLVGNVGSIGGLSTVVDTYVDPNTFIVGDCTAVEFYENSWRAGQAQRGGCRRAGLQHRGSWHVGPAQHRSWLLCQDHLHATQAGCSGSLSWLQQKQPAKLMADWLTLDQYKAWARIS